MTEISTYRKEIKYIVPLIKILKMKDFLNAFLEKDNYSAAGPYSVRSLYFDSINDTDYYDKFAGISERKKLRVRTYNGNFDTCKLEIKQKRGENQKKNSFVIASADAKELILGNYDVIKNYFETTNSSKMVYGIMKVGRYRPKVIIEYDRIAYQYPLYDTRITLDMNIRASETNLNLFDKGSNYIPLMFENAVLEIKYSGKLMGFISEALQKFELTQSAYSKYCFGRRIYENFD